MQTVNVCQYEIKVWFSVHVNRLRRGNYQFVDLAPDRYRKNLDAVLMPLFGTTLEGMEGQILVNGYCDVDCLMERVKELDQTGLEEARQAYQNLSDDEREFVDRYFAQFMNRSLWSYFRSQPH